MPRRFVVGLVAALVAATAPPLVAQVAWDPGRIQVTRADLQDLLRRLDEAAASTAYSQAVRDRARADATQIRTRLAEGDFHVGDRISLTVENEQALSDTFDVRDGRVLRLPVIGDVALAGVLRSELEEHLKTELTRYFRNPIVRARSMVRLSLLGEVARPGYYVVPTDMVLSDALMLAGGPTPSAKLDVLRVERAGQTVWSGKALQEAIALGRTIDQLNIRAGDQIVVPRKGSGVFSEGSVRTISLIISLPIAIYGLVQIFK